MIIKATTSQEKKKRLETYLNTIDHRLAIKIVQQKKEFGTIKILTKKCLKKIVCSMNIVIFVINY